MKLLGAILAGGRAARMGGGDKCLLEVGGNSLLSHVITRLRPQVSEMILNSNGDPSRFAAFELPIIADSITGFAGPLAGVLAGMDYAAEHGFEDIITVAADTPFFPDTLVNALIEARETAGTPLAMAMTPDPKRGLSRHPTFGLWPVALREDLRVAIKSGTSKIVAWTEPHGCAKAVFPVEPFDPFFNVNTPQDLLKAGELL